MGHSGLSVWTQWFCDLKEAKHLIESWRREYNDSRPYQSLGDRTPSQFASESAASRALTGELAGRPVTERLVRTTVIVFPSPGFDQVLCLLQVTEPLCPDT